MPLEFNPAMLEPLGDIDGEVPASMLATFIAYSQAVSLKRIADALEREDIRTVELKPESNAEPMITLRASQFPPRPDVPQDEKQPTKGKLLDSLPSAATAAGFLPHDNSPTSPIDRNREVMIFHANGKKRKQFGGAVAWAVKPDDPWRVLGWKDLGDGALSAAGTDG